MTLLGAVSYETCNDKGDLGPLEKYETLESARSLHITQLTKMDYQAESTLIGLWMDLRPGRDLETDRRLYLGRRINEMPMDSGEVAPG